MPFVDPARVGELRARLRPAFAELASGSQGPAGGALGAEGLAWCAGPPVGLLDAPAALERGRDLEARLGLLRPRQGARVGTILGLPTVGELADLVAAQRYQLGAFNAMRGCPPWAAADPQGYGKWAADLFDASTALTAALDAADTVINLTPNAIADYTPADVPWAAVLAAAHPFADLMRRYIQAGFCPVPDMSGMPQPKHPDVDLRAYLWTDQATKTIEKTAKAAVSGAGSLLKPVLFGAGAVVAVLLLTRGRR